MRGFGLRRGAFASTVAHDAHNLVVAGVDDDDMAACVARLVELGGGVAVAAGGAVRGELALPVAGLLSEAPAEEVAAGLDALAALLREQGVTVEAPFITLSFLALSVIPALKLTDRGLVDVERARGRAAHGVARERASGPRGQAGPVAVRPPGGASARRILLGCRQ